MAVFPNSSGPPSASSGFGPEDLTRYLLLGFAVLAVFYDLFVVLLFGNKATISQVCLNLCRDYPVIPFALGFILGHILWPQ
jgi:hypothetical protein